MAGDWIKMRSALPTCPKTAAVARAIGTAEEFSGLSRQSMRLLVVGGLHAVWAAVNEHTGDGVMENACLEDVDDIAGIDGFGQAMRDAGWLEVDEAAKTLTFPNFGQWNTPAKDSTAAERMRKHREKQRVTDPLRVTVTDESATVTDPLPVTVAPLRVTVTPDKTRQDKIRKQERETAPPSRADAEDRKPGHALPAWEELREAWSQAAARCRHIAPFGSLHPPAAFLDRLDELAWRDDWRRGIERLEKCRWFTTPVSLTFFLKPDTLAAILAGQYDPRKPAKPGEPQSHGPVVSTRMWRDDACQNMTDEQYAAWRRTAKEVAS